MSDQEFVETIVRAIVAHPEDVKTERKIDERGVLITLSIHPEDMGYVIGRQGQTARAIRTLLKIVGAKNQARVNLKINEPEGSTHRRMSDPVGAGAGMGMSSSWQSPSIDTAMVDDLKI